MFPQVRREETLGSARVRVSLFDVLLNLFENVLKSFHNLDFLGLSFGSLLLKLAVKIMETFDELILDLSITLLTVLDFLIHLLLDQWKLLIDAFFQHQETLITGLDFCLHVLSLLVFSLPQLFIYSLEAFLTVSPEVVESVCQDGLSFCQLISALVKQRCFLFPFIVKQFHNLLDL
jgi:hypothetical protein